MMTLLTESQEKDTDSTRPWEDDKPGDGREYEPAEVCPEEDETVPVAREVHLAGKPRVAWWKGRTCFKLFIYKSWSIRYIQSGQ